MCLRYLLALLLSAVLLLSACGTSAPPPAASEVLTAMLTAVTDTAQPLPDGVIRLSSAPADSPDCLTETSICNQILITRNCKPAGRIKFVLVGEELGF